MGAERGNEDRRVAAVRGAVWVREGEAGSLSGFLLKFWVDRQTLLDLSQKKAQFASVW